MVPSSVVFIADSVCRPEIGFIPKGDTYAMHRPTNGIPRLVGRVSLGAVSFLSYLRGIQVEGYDDAFIIRDESQSHSFRQRKTLR